MKNKIARIKDIALKANVSAGTVDRVLHNRGKVSEKVHQRILKAIRDLDYEPNLMARALGAKKACNLAVLMPGAQYDTHWNISGSGILKAKTDLKQYSINIAEYFFDPLDAASFVSKARELTDNGADGILLSPVFNTEVQPFFERWETAGIPFVLFNTTITSHKALGYIGPDAYQSGQLAARLLHYGLPDPCSVLVAHITNGDSPDAHSVKKEQGFGNYFTHNSIDQKYTVLKAGFDCSTIGQFAEALGTCIENNAGLQGIYVTTEHVHFVAAYLKQRHIKHIRLTGHDLLPKNVYFLTNNVISFLINQNPKGQAYTGIHQLASHLVFKKEVPLFTYLPLDVIAKENVNYFLDDE